VVIEQATAPDCLTVDLRYRDVHLPGLLIREPPLAERAFKWQEELRQIVRAKVPDGQAIGHLPPGSQYATQVPRNAQKKPWCCWWQADWYSHGRQCSHPREDGALAVCKYIARSGA
jgi:hypothetical protein